MLIFDQFPTRERAEAFAAQVRADFGRKTAIYDDVASAQAADPFPFVLIPPIVHVERDNSGTDPARDVEIERAIEDLVSSFSGVFAGT